MSIINCEYYFYRNFLIYPIYLLFYLYLIHFGIIGINKIYAKIILFQYIWDHIAEFITINMCNTKSVT
jgi:hypothetical protein